MEAKDALFPLTHQLLIGCEGGLLVAPYLPDQRGVPRWIEALCRFLDLGGPRW
jgi:hypothetical protein